MDTEMRHHNMTTGNWLRRSYRGWLWLLLLVLIPALPARAVTNPPCGSTVTSNVTLTMDITCTESATTPVATWITIGADNITVDLNGSIVQCTNPTGPSQFQSSCQQDPLAGTVPVGINTNGHSNIRIINSNEDESGVIEGFDVGVWVNRGSNVRVNGIMITGPNNPSSPTTPGNPRPVAQGILVTGVACGMYNDPSNDSNLFVKISSNSIFNHSEGIDLNNAMCVKLQGNTVINNNSDLHESHGILLENGSSYNKTVENNVFGNGENAPFDGGITVTGSSNNLITQNEVSNNNGDGISLRNGATGNLVQDNEMLFNGDPFTGVTAFDAAARNGGLPGSSGGSNTWKDNECITATSPEPPTGACKEDEPTMRHPPVSR
jgi:parallel beta-helix repeat protein